MDTMTKGSQSSQTVTQWGDADADQLAQWLGSLRYPRPFQYKTFVTIRRAVFGFVALLLLAVCVGAPMASAIDHMTTRSMPNQLVAYQVTILFGAMIVFAFVWIGVQSSRVYENARWLVRYGAVGDASILFVVSDGAMINITYRFWDFSGIERRRETTMRMPGKAADWKLRSGQIIPVLFDPQKPADKNLLWLEVAAYTQVNG